MKIRLEITLDNGTKKDTEIIGTPTSESILNLINQLLTLHTASDVVSSSQPEVPAGMPLPTQQSQTQQPPQPQDQYIHHKPPNMRGIRNVTLAEEEYSRMKNESLTIKERLELFLHFEYQDNWFTSLDVKRDYDRVYGTINLSTVSTYLSRLYRENKLERWGNRNQRKYRLKAEGEQQEYRPETVWKGHNPREIV